MGLRERKKQQTQRRIVDAALHRFAQHGYEATTVEQICDDANVSVTTFFRYFRAKSEVLFGHNEGRGSDLQALIKERPAHESDLMAVHQALRIFHERGGFEDDARRLRRYRVTNETPVLRGRAQEDAAHWQQEVATALAQRRSIPADSQEVRFTTAIAFTILRFAEHEWCAQEGAVDWLTSLAEAFDCYASLVTKSCLTPSAQSHPPAAQD